MPATTLTYKKPIYLGTELQAISLAAEVKSRAEKLSERTAAGRAAVAKIIHGTFVKIARVNSTTVILTDDTDVPTGFDLIARGYVVFGDTETGSITIKPEKV